MAHHLTHLMCGHCWTSAVSTRLPRTEGTPGIEHCCFCNRPTSGGLTFRAPLSQTPYCPDVREAGDDECDAAAVVRGR